MFENILNFFRSFCDFDSQIKYVNHNCPVCMERSDAIPNAGGRFFIINDTQCQCNGCNAIFQKSEFFVDVNTLEQRI